MSEGLGGLCCDLVWEEVGVSDRRNIRWKGRGEGRDKKWRGRRRQENGRKERRREREKKWKEVKKKARGTIKKKFDGQT